MKNKKYCDDGTHRWSREKGEDGPPNIVYCEYCKVIQEFAKGMEPAKKKPIPKIINKTIENKMKEYL